jgi:deoxyribose-phosphate aldolase
LPVAEGITGADAKTAARRLLPLLDLATIDEAADEAAIRRLCARARTAAGPVASVCVPPRFIGLAKDLLTHSTVHVATVANFPDGAADIAGVTQETAEAVAFGADEIEIVFPYRAFLAGDSQIGRALVRACRRACRRPDGPAALVKVILETGRLGDAATIRRAAGDAIDSGADIVATSTGRVEPGATLPAATALLDAIAASRARRIWAGLKIAGGVGTLSEAMAYLALAERRLGGEFLGPGTFRIAASRLLDEALAALGIGE